MRGRALRFVLLDELRQRPTMTVADMVDTLVGYGFDLGGRPSKVISDALRWERDRNRVKQLDRGVYAFAQAPPATVRRIQIFATQCRAWIVATTRNQNPPPTPPDRRLTGQTQDPTRPPWQHLGWLWTA